MMSSGVSKHPFFQKLKAVACSVSSDVNDIERKLQKSKFELPENNALFKLVHLTDDMENFKNKSSAILQQLIEDNKKYTLYQRDVDCLIAEMEKNIDQVEESLSKYEYKKWKPEHLLQDDSDQSQSAGCNTLHFKEKPLTENRIAEQKKTFSSPKTPVLADYGLTTKIPKPLSSVLKGKQGSRMKSLKKVHFESPKRQPDKGRENQVPYSLQKTPLLDDYGLASRKCNVEIDQGMDLLSIRKELNFRSPLRQPDKGRENQVPYSLQKTPLLEDYGLPSRKLSVESQGMDLLSIKKELNFRSPLSSISENVAESNETVALRAADVDDSDNFKELISSFPPAMKISQPGIITKRQTNVKISTPEEPRLCGSQRIKLTIKKEKPATPEEPAITPLSHPLKKGSTTPEEPQLEPVTLSKSTNKVIQPSTPKTPKLDVKLSSFDEWLRQQKKKFTY